MRVRRWVSPEASALRRATGEDDPVAAIEKLAAGLIDDGGFAEPPFDPAILASFQGVREIRPLAMVSAARLVPERGGLVIEVNRDHSAGKRNFSVNHETTHTLVPTYTGQLVHDDETGTFSGSREEEILCDIGAAALLLDPRWLRPLAAEAGPSIATLIELGSLFNASLQATARQVAALHLWPCAFVFWEEGDRKAERISNGQALIPGFAELGSPRQKLRVKASYVTRSFGHFVANNKSVPDTSLIAGCCENEPLTFGIEDVLLSRSSGEARMYTENYHVPYRHQGAIRRRIISLLMPAERSGQRSASMAMPRMETLEAF